MSVYNPILSVKSLSLLTKSVLIEIMQYPEGTTQGVYLLAWKFGMSVDSITKSTNQLSSLGLISKRRLITRKGSARILTPNFDAIDEYVKARLTTPPNKTAAIIEGQL